MDFAVIGGDMRHAKLAELLYCDGHSVSVFALDRFSFSENVTKCSTVKEAVKNAQCVVLPLPSVSRDGMLNAPLSFSQHTIKEVFSALEPEQLVLAGRVDNAVREEASSFGIQLTDYFDREELAVKNAVATVEGALSIIMDETPITVRGMNCLIIGYGRLGKLLSHRLSCLGANVTASARKFSDMAWIESYGCRAVNTAALDGTLSQYDVVVNTVPARVLSENRLSELKEGCLCLDLASNPGGTDFSAASKLGVHAIWALSLPGEAAPTSAGANIRDTVYNILTEKGASV